jgi:hypothetical protein
LRRVARFGDGWMPLLAPGQDASRIVDRLRFHLDQEGRDIASFGLQANVWTERGRETDWLNEAKHLRSLGVTHLGIGRLVRDSAPMATLNRAIAAKELIKTAVDSGG